jgi:hypothetical protein
MGGGSNEWTRFCKSLRLAKSEQQTNGFDPLPNHEYIVLFATCFSLFAIQGADNETFNRNSFIKKLIKQL